VRRDLEVSKKTAEEAQQALTRTQQEKEEAKVEFEKQLWAQQVSLSHTRTYIHLERDR
jgi:hypothetical protein